MSEHLANNAVTQLDGNVLPIDTTITVLSSVGFPTANFRILIDSELMLVTGTSGNVWTVTRGVEGTINGSHTTGAGVASVLTAGGLQALIDQELSGSGDTPPIPTQDGCYTLVVSGGVPSWVGRAFG